MNAKTPIDALVTETDEADKPAEEEDNRVLLHMPVDIRSASLALLAVLGSLYTLYWAKAVFIPVLLGLMASYALTPVVDRLQRWHVPRVLASALLLSAIVTAVTWIGWHLRNDASALIESLPEVAQRFRESIQNQQGPRAKPATAIEKCSRPRASSRRPAETRAASAPAATAA
jgi:predicted PurR-regulated permease PerM